MAEHVHQPKYDTVSGNVSRVRWRGFERASGIERDMADWIINDAFPGSHPDDGVRRAFFSTQYLFSTDSSLQYLIIIPAASGDYPTFYIIYLTGPDNWALIGDNIIGEEILSIHPSWIVNGAKVLSGIIDGEWVGYVYDGKKYSLNTSSFKLMRMQAQLNLYGNTQ